MLRKSVLVIFCTLLLGPAWSAWARDPSLAGWWKLDETSGNVAADSSGNGNNGTVNGTAVWVPGMIKGALQFDGSSTWVDCGRGASVNVTDAVTITAWIKPDFTGQDYKIAGNQDNVGGGYKMGVYSTNMVEFEIRTAANATSSNRNAAGGTALQQGVWYHVAGVYVKGQYYRTYVNGNLDRETTTTLTAGSSTESFKLGRETYGAASRLWRGALDEVAVFSRALTADELKNVMKSVGGESAAGNPSPADRATDVPRDATLSWTAGDYPATHDVYFGTAFADVNTASRADTKGVLTSKGQVDTMFDPPGSVAYGQTYYWRIDEVNKSPDGTIYKGGMWSFTAEPYGYPVKPVKATASSSQASMGPENTINGSGLTGDLHGTEPATMWMSTGAQPNWIQYEFDKVYKLHQLLVWNSNQLIEGFLGFGAKKVTIETSTDGATWKALADVPEFARAPGAPGYAANTTINLGGIEAKFVKLTINTNWGGMAPATGLAEVRFLYVPVQARVPQPATGVAGVSIDASLNWRPGREAGSHKVFVGTDPDAVAQGTVAAKTVTDHSVSPGSLNLATTYYWRVDEVNTVTYPGDVWSFTTETFKGVDDFESYTDKAGEEIFSTWVDGLANNYKSNGSTVGLDVAKNGTFCETTIVHGGTQSMPLRYDNTKASVSEAVRTFDAPRNWTTNGVKSLSLWFQGVAGNTGQFYIKINGTKISYNGAAGDLAKAIWTPWNIDLSTSGASLDKVTSLTIGVEGVGAQGTLYIDDIRLYPKTPAYITPVDPGKATLVGYWTLDGNTNDASGKGNNGTVTAGTAQWVAGQVGQALQFNGGPMYVDCGTGPSLNLTDAVTVVAWMKMDFTAGDRKIAANQDGVAGGYKLGLYSNNKVEFEVRNAANGGANNLNRNVAGGTVLQQGVWYHVAGVYSKGQFIRTYVFGNLDRELLTTAVLDATKGPFKIGRGESATTYFWLGALDEVQVYNKALSQEELLWLAGQKTAAAKPF